MAKVLPKALREMEYNHTQSHHKKPKAHETLVADSLGGRRRLASGAIEGMKGDVSDVSAHAFEFLVECKRTEGKSLRLEARWLDKIAREASKQAGRSPALAMQVEQADEQDWIAVPLSTFRRMLMMLGQDDDIFNG